MTDRNLIIVAGDSWAAGVHDNDDPNLVHDTGFQLHLRNAGYRVINLARQGGSNLEAIERVSDFLKCNQHELSNIKCVIFSVTEFFRDIWYYKSGKSTNGSSLESELKPGYIHLRDSWTYRPYYRLTESAQQWNIPIYVLGGCSDTVWYDNFGQDFPGVHILMQSVTNFLLTGEHRVEDPVHCLFQNGWIDSANFLETIKANIKSSELDQLINDIDKGQRRLDQYDQNQQLFYPDGTHPNEEAQRTMFEYMLPIIQAA